MESHAERNQPTFTSAFQIADISSSSGMEKPDKEQQMSCSKRLQTEVGDGKRITKISAPKCLHLQRYFVHANLDDAYSNASVISVCKA